MWRLLVLVAALSIFTGSLSGIVTGQIVKSSIDASNHAQAARLLHAQISACYRTNIGRAAANRNAKANYDENTLFAGAVATPRPHSTRKERRLTLAFHARLTDVVATVTWTPLVLDCATAPTTVELPITFSTRPAPRTDLRLTQATAGPYLAETLNP